MTTISTRDRSHLRALAHPLKPLVQIGGEGISEGLVAAVVEALTEHELIKVKVGQSYAGDRKEAAREIATAAGADLTQVVGRVVTLYRRREKELPSRPRIKLPSEG